MFVYNYFMDVYFVHSVLFAKIDVCVCVRACVSSSLRTLAVEGCWGGSLIVVFPVQYVLARFSVVFFPLYV